MQKALRPLLHDDPDEHFHDDDEGGYNEHPSQILQAEDVLGLEAFRQKSVGIDIGSSTSHLIFSELLLRREGYSSRFRVTERQVTFQSRILLTPYVSDTLIDSKALELFIEQAYAEAGVDPSEVDSGAVVITGEALKKENAQPILELFSRQAGKFICASAGPNHEALLAAYGSGAVALSEKNHWRVLAVDVGGGTSKFALIDNGAVLATAAINVGARLIAFDEAGKLTRIEDPARVILGADDGQHPDLKARAGSGSGGHGLELGREASDAVKDVLSRKIVDCLFDLVLGPSPSPLTQALMITDPLQGYRGPESVDRFVFCGGVSEYVYARDGTTYGDLGALIGARIRERLDKEGLEPSVVSSSGGIRATVIGAGEYTIQASGTTSLITNREHLPVYALRVVKPDDSAPGQLQDSVLRALRKYDLSGFTDGLALAVSLDDPPYTYPYLRHLAEAIMGVAASAENSLACLFLILDKDAAKTIGSILREELAFAPDIVAIDGIDLGDLDYVDIGRPMGASEVLPVTVKSLVFPNRAEV